MDTDYMYNSNKINDLVRAKRKKSEPNKINSLHRTHFLTTVFGVRMITQVLVCLFGGRARSRPASPIHMESRRFRLFSHLIHSKKTSKFLLHHQQLIVGHATEEGVGQHTGAVRPERDLFAEERICEIHEITATNTHRYNNDVFCPCLGGMPPSIPCPCLTSDAVSLPRSTLHHVHLCLLLCILTLHRVESAGKFLSMCVCYRH